jgi:hypothetical protein
MLQAIVLAGAKEDDTAGTPQAVGIIAVVAVVAALAWLAHKFK